MTAAARLASGLGAPAWVFAHEQTGGRGRYGRPWRMPAGNFAATLIFRPAGGSAQAALYSFVAALALEAALAQICGPHARLAIKWPNDVLLNGGKVAGILLESVSTGAKPDHLAVGIGVNLAAAPDPGQLEERAMLPVSLLGETGVRIAPLDFLPPLATAFAHYDRQLRDCGFDAIRDAWLVRAARLGERIVARTGSHSHEGIFETIDSHGALILREARGTRAIAAADIFF